MLEKGSQFLPKDDPDMVKFLADQMKKDGVEFLFNGDVVEFSKG